MRYEVRPLRNWTRPLTVSRRRATFRVHWDVTLEQLAYETGRLGAELVVLEIEVPEAQIRRDGMLRADARVSSPPVRISFESRFGPLTYATDTFDHWQDNVRAIALSLEALRAVDRYGVSTSGEQYRGWNAISNRPAEFTPDQAAEFIAHLAGDASQFPADKIRHDRGLRTRAYRAAARRVHPDTADGDHDTMSRLGLAKDLLDGRAAR